VDPDRVTQIAKAAEAAQADIAQSILISKVALVVFGVLGAFILVGGGLVSWREARRWRIERLVGDRLFQEEHPEAWERRRARQALIDELVDAELARRRQASWPGRLLARVRRAPDRGA